MTVETTTTRRTSTKPARQREAEQAAMRRLPRSYWDPGYYADPRNANLARSIMSPVDAPGMLTEAQFHRAHIAAQASMYSPNVAVALEKVLSGSPTLSPGVATSVATIMRSMSLPQVVIDDILTLDAEVRASDPNTAGRKPDSGSEAEKGWLSNVLGEVARPAFALASMPFEVLIGSVRSAVGSITGGEEHEPIGMVPGVPDIVESAFTQSLGGQYLAGLVSPEMSADLGEGYVPRGDVHARQVQATRNAAPLVFNHAWTLGRGVGSIFFEDDESLLYRNLSGFIDLIANVVLDPFVLVGKSAAATRLLRRDIAEQVRRDLGERTEEALLERELVEFATAGERYAEQAEVVSRATLDTANDVARQMGHLYAQAASSPMTAGDASAVANAAIRRDMMADAEDLLRSETPPRVAREATRITARRELLETSDQITESERAVAMGELEARARRAGPSARAEQDMLDSIDELTTTLGDDGLNAMTAKVVGDSPELPGVFTDAVPLVARSKTLPGSEDGIDAIVRFTDDPPRIIPSVDDWVINPEQMVRSLKRTMKGRSNDRSKAVAAIIAKLADPDVRYTDILTDAAENNVGAPILIALRESEVEGITDIFRLTGGEGGVWWTTTDITTAHWADGNWVMRDLTPQGLGERRTMLTEQRDRFDAEQRAAQKVQTQAARFSEMLGRNYVTAVDQRTSVADSYDAVRNAVEMGFGVRRPLGRQPQVSHEGLKEALFNPANSFDAAIGASGQIPAWMRASEQANRAMVAVTTLGASEALRAARRYGVEPFLARSRQRVLDEMVELSDSPESLGRLHRLTGGKIDPALMQAIMRADTEEKVLETLGPALGIGITRPIGPDVFQAQRLRLNSITGGRANDVLFGKALNWIERAASISPRLGAYMNLTDPQGSADTLRNYMTNLPVVSVATVDRAVGDYLMQTTEVGRGSAVRKAMDTVADELSEYHANQKRLVDRQPWDGETVRLLNDSVRAATRVHEGGRAKVNDWWLGKYSSDSSIGYMTVDGQLVHLTGPQLEAELARGGMVLPHMGEMRDAMGRWGTAIQKVPGLKEARDLLDFGMDYWRASVLFRYAYTLRNIGEMQFRMFLSGHSSIFNDPVGSLAMASGMNRRTRTSRGMFSRFARYNKTATGKELGDVTGVDLDAVEEGLAEYVAVMSRTSSHHDMRTMRAMEAHHDVREVGVDQPGFTVGWAEELIKLNHSSLARIVAGFTPAQVRAKMRQGVDREDAVVDWLLHSQTSAGIRNDYLEAGESYAKIFTDPTALRQFLFDSPASVRARVMEYTGGGNEELLQFVARGALSRDGETLFTMSTRNPNPEVRQLMMARRANNLAKVLTPFKGDLSVDRLRMRVHKSRRTPKGVADAILDGFFEWNGRKENAWAMGPEFAYAFNDSVAGLMRAMNPLARQEAFDFIKGAERRFRPHSEVMIRAKQAMRAEPGSLNMDDVEKVAARQASEHVKTMFYDARNRNQIFHMLRMVMPFAQPFVNTLWSWGRLMAARPYMVEKIGRLGTALTEEGSGVIYDDFDAIDPFTDRQSRDPTQGFIYTDPLSGEQMFSFPLIGSVLGAIFSPVAGVNLAEAAQLRAPVSGLNLAFQGDIDFLPSLGPIMTIPISVLMPDDAFGAIPEFVRDFAFPYGEPQLEGGVFESVFLPSWGRRLLGALWNEKFRAYSYKGLLAYYASTGEYPNLAGDPQMQQQLMDDVQGAAKWLTLIRAAGAAGLPAAPSQEIYAADKDGSMIGVTYLADHFNHIKRELGDDFEAAVAVFIDTYGEQALGAIVPATEGDIPISGPGWEFHKRHASKAEAYADILGAFFPGDYSFEAAQFMEERGNRSRLSVEERTKKLLEFMYGAEKRQLEGKAAREQWAAEDMEEAEEQLQRRYGGVIPTFTGESSQVRLDKVRNALDTFEELRETRAGEGALLLFDAYDRWLDEAERLHGTGLGARAASRERQSFLEELDAIGAEYGGQNIAQGSVDTIAGYFVNVVTPRS